VTSAIEAAGRPASAGVIDLDRAATTPVHPDVLTAMLPWFSANAGNPSSLHRAGRAARRAVEDARERLAEALEATPRQVVFTSGATEALHLAVLGSLALRPAAHVVASAAEHAALLEAVRAAERRGHPVTWVPSGCDGRIAHDELVAALRDDTALVAVMRTNNETGVQNDLAPLREHFETRGVRVLVDAVQAFGVERVGLEPCGADLLVVSSHKVEGPKGCGALLLRDGVVVEPQQRGGGQERGLRGGTVDVPAVVGFGRAALRATSWQDRAQRVAALRDRLERGVCAIGGVTVHGSAAPRGPKHVHVHVGGIDGETLLINLDREGVLASAGSACAAGSLEPSHVLLAMGRSAAEARASVRFSLGDHLDEAAIDEAVRRVRRAVRTTRGLEGAA
jgi:cysteine desulfurase